MEGRTQRKEGKKDKSRAGRRRTGVEGGGTFYGGVVKYRMGA